MSLERLQGNDRERDKETTEPQIAMALAFIVFEKAFDSIYSRAITKEVGKPYVETLTKILKAAKARLKFMKIAQVRQLPKKYDKEK